MLLVKISPNDNGCNIYNILQVRNYENDILIMGHDEDVLLQSQ